MIHKGRFGTYGWCQKKWAILYSDDVDLIFYQPETNENHRIFRWYNNDFRKSPRLWSRPVSEKSLNLGETTMDDSDYKFCFKIRDKKFDIFRVQ